MNTWYLLTIGYGALAAATLYIFGLKTLREKKLLGLVIVPMCLAGAGLLAPYLFEMVVAPELKALEGPIKVIGFVGMFVVGMAFATIGIGAKRAE